MFISAVLCVLCVLALPASSFFIIGSRSPNSIFGSPTTRYTTPRSPNSIFNSPATKYTTPRSPNSIFTSPKVSRFTSPQPNQLPSYSKSYRHEDYDLYPLNNAALQKKIERYHNEFRTQVQPPASNMLYMHWNAEAARQAQKYADVCRFVEHNSWKDRILKNYGSCGQNLFGSQVKMDWFTAIESWYSEYVNFTYGSPHNVFTEIGHYTQMVWATSHQVGCGVAFCKGGPWGQFYNYVCHYCPSGNFDYYPYKIGRSCSDCPYECTWGSLCTNSCPKLDDLGNCGELLVEPDICSTGECEATCFCSNKIYKNYPWV